MVKCKQLRISQRVVGIEEDDLLEDNLLQDNDSFPLSRISV